MSWAGLSFNKMFSVPGAAGAGGEGTARERWLQLRALREARGRAWGLEVKSVKCLSRKCEDLSVPFLVGCTCNPKAWEAGIRPTPESHWPAGLVYLVNFRPMRDYVSKKKMGSQGGSSRAKLSPPKPKGWSRGAQRPGKSQMQ